MHDCRARYTDRHERNAGSSNSGEFLDILMAVRQTSRAKSDN